MSSRRPSTSIYTRREGKGAYHELEGILMVRLVSQPAKDQRQAHDNAFLHQNVRCRLHLLVVCKASENLAHVEESLLLPGDGDACLVSLMDRLVKLADQMRLQII